MTLLENRPYSEPTFSVSPSDHHENVMQRYEELFGHRRSVAISEALAVAVTATDLPQHQADHFLRHFIKAHFDQDSLLPPDGSMFCIDRILGRREIERRFGWERGLNVGQVSALITALSGADIRAVTRQLSQDLAQTYPSLAQASAKPKFEIPAAFFLNWWANFAHLPQAILEAAIRQHHISPVEYTVLVLTTKGTSNGQIALALDTSRHTVKHHQSALFEKLHVYDRTQALISALQSGLVPYQLVVPLISPDQLENYDQLTPRALALLELITQGKSNKEIAAALKILPSTVKNHLTSIFATLGVTSRTQAAVIWLVVQSHQAENQTTASNS